jgi:hypothetical protein
MYREISHGHSRSHMARRCVGFEEDVAILLLQDASDKIQDISLG